MTHHRIWKFRPPEGCEEEFATAYSSGGVWAQLFRKAPGFQGTTLLKPSKHGGCWLTIDRWDSSADFESFTQAFGEQYRALDAQLEGIAGEEEFVGTFEGG